MPVNAYVQQTTMPPWMEAMYKNLAEQAQSARTEKFIPYPEKFAPIPNYPEFGPDLQKAFEMSRTSLGEFQPFLGEARGLLRRGTETFPEQYKNYMTPYEEEIAALGKRARRDYEEQFLPTLANLFIGSGQENSTQYQKLAERGARNAEENFANQKAALMRQAQEQALKAFQADQARALEGATGAKELGISAQAAKLADIVKMLEQGQMQYAREQGKFGTQAQRFTEAREHPWTQIGKQAAAVHGFPTPTTESGAYHVQGQPQMNTAGNLGSLAGSLYGASMKYGRKAGGFINKRMNIPKLKSLKPTKPTKPKKYAAGGRTIRPPKVFMQAPEIKKGLGKLSLTQPDIVRQPKVGGKHSLVKGRK